MDLSELTPIEQVIALIESGQNFVLQGGAGSGKTEALKQVVMKIAENDPQRKIACITHTNKASDEIAERVGGDYTISTIHSFLGGLIKPFKSNIHRVFPELFVLPLFEARGDNYYDGDETLRKSQEHERFKKLYGKLAMRRLSVIEADTDKVTGKHEYDKDPEQYNAALNARIEEVNVEIRRLLGERDASDISYNETQFDSFEDVSFGHDGLIEIASLLFDKYPMLGKIVADKFDCIFVDEYQDTKADVIRVLLRGMPENSRLVIGLFGDSEQAIYEDGIGSAEEYIKTGELTLVPKADNYRCSPQVIDVVNQFRTDGLEQKVALKTLEDGSIESPESREGSAHFYYSIAPHKPDTGNVVEDRRIHKQDRLRALDALVDEATKRHPSFVQLKLTNKSIANDAGFGRLYEIFDKRYREPREELERTLDRLQFNQLFELVYLFENLENDQRGYNRLISILKKFGFAIRSVSDKAKLQKNIETLANSDHGAYETLEFATKHNLTTQSESRRLFVERRNLELSRLAGDSSFADFESLFNQGHTTKIQMTKALARADCTALTQDILAADFDEKLRDLKRKRFYEDLVSPDLPFSEVLAYYRYEMDDSNFSTMHKTKGTGIENILVVLDEYSWTQYDFLSCFSGESPKPGRETQTRKLLYVACSRAKKNLVCVRLVENLSEATKIAGFFPTSAEI